MESTVRNAVIVVLAILLIGIGSIGFILYQQHIEGKEKLRAIQDELTETHEKVTLLNEERDELLERLRKAEEALKLSRNNKITIAELEGAIQTNDQEIADTRKEIGQLQKTEGDLEAQLLSGNKAMASLQQWLKSLDTQIVSLGTKTEESQKQLLGFQGRLSDLKEEKSKEIQNTRAHIVDLEKAIQRREQELTEAKGRVGQLMENQENLEVKLLSRDETVVSIQQQLKDSNTQIGLLSKKMEESQELLLGFQGRLSDLKEEKSKEIQNTRAHIVNLEKAIQRREQELTEARGRVGQLEQNQENLEAGFLSRDKTVASIQQQLKESSTQISSLSKKMEENQKQFLGFQGRLSDLSEEKSEEIENTRAHIVDLEKAIQRREQELAEAKGRVRQLRENQEGLEARFLLRDKIATSIQQQLKESSTQIGSLIKKMDKSQRLLQDSQTELSALKMEKTKELEKTRARIDDLEKALQMREQELAEAKQRVRQLTENQKSLEDTFPLRDKTVISIQQRLKDSNTQIGSLSKKMEESQKLLLVFQTKLSALEMEKTKELEHTRARILDLEKTIQIKEQELEETREKVQQLQNNQKGLRTKLLSRDETVASLRQKMKDSDTQIAVLKRKIEESQEKLKSLQAQFSDLYKEKGVSEVESEAPDFIDSACRDLMFDLKKHIENGDIIVQKLRGKLCLSFVESVLFNSGSSSINRQGRKILKKLLKFLKKVKCGRIRVVGHTDDVPIHSQYRYQYKTNWELSVRRSSAVIRYLQKKDIDPNKLEAVGRSFYQPVGNNETKAGRAKNRRVEIVIWPTTDSELPASSSTSPIDPPPQSE
jgi:chemotaxis protein MotB